MALSSSDRKNLSKRFVNIPEDNANALVNIDQLNTVLAQLNNEDVTYKSLFDSDNTLVEAYQLELDRLLGQIRTTILEQDFLDSAIKLTGNFFFPNQNNVPTPGISDGVWKQLKSYAGNKALGKTYSEIYQTQDSEIDKITAVTTLTSSIQTDYSESERQTSTPDSPPPPPFNLPTDLQNLKDAVDGWESWLQAQQTALTSNTDTTQTSENSSALADVNNALSILTSWKALSDYALNGKVSNSGLNLLNSEASARTTFISNRISQIQIRLGDIVQTSNGSVTLTGLYGNRYINIESRINLSQGTLSKISPIELGIRVQTEIITDNNSYLDYLTNSVLVASKFAASSEGTNIVQVEDGTLFSVLDTVYVIAEDQSELTGSIVHTIGNIIVLDFTVPNTFTKDNLSRLVREL